MYTFARLKGREFVVAQLIKLQDYVTRYETDISRYPAQYVRLKKQQWDKLYETWKIKDQEIEQIDQDNHLIGKITGWLKRDKTTVIDYEQETIDEEESTFSDALMDAQTEEELKRMFLNELYSFQLKWASSTIIDQSYIEKKYYFDERLKHFLQRFPDTFFVFYEPIFLMKQAPVELEVIIITPTETWCLAFLEEENQSIFTGSKDHFWQKRLKGKESKVLNPLLSLQRMANIIEQVYLKQNIELPIKKAVVSRNGYLDYADVSTDILLVDKRGYEKWQEKMRAHMSPLKMIQLKAAQSLLDHCQTTFKPRIDWSKSSKNE